MRRSERVARLLAKVEPHEFSTCLLWTGHENPSGYGRCWFPLDRETPHHSYVHRVFYVLIRGPIPKGLALHHTCGTKLCVNPYHLEPVTWSQNWANSHNSGALPRNETIPEHDETFF